MRTYLVSARMHLVSAGSHDTYMYIRMYQGYIQLKKKNIMPSKRSGCHTRTAPGLHPKTKKEQNAQHTLTERHTHRDRQRFELVPKIS